MYRQTIQHQTDLGWYVETSNLKSQLFRTIKVEWDEDSVNFTITGSQYEEGKYATIDNGARLEVRPTSNIPAGTQVAPGVITVSSYSYIEQTMSVTTMTASWDMVAGAIKYEAQWRKDGGDWIPVGTIYANHFDVKGIYSGVYTVRARAISSVGAISSWTQSDPVTLTGKVGEPPALASFTTISEVWGIRINWTFKDGSDTGATLCEIDIPSNTNPIPFYVAIPQEGILFQTGIYMALSAAVTGVTIFYG